MPYKCHVVRQVDEQYLVRNDESLIISHSMDAAANYAV